MFTQARHERLSRETNGAKLAQPLTSPTWEDWPKDVSFTTRSRFIHHRAKAYGKHASGNSSEAEYTGVIRSASGKLLSHARYCARKSGATRATLSLNELIDNNLSVATTLFFALLL